MSTKLFFKASFVAVLVFLSAQTQAALVSHWKFDGDANDSQGTNHGTVYGAQWTTGKVDGALSFDGDNDYVLIPADSSINFINTSFSISAWVFPHQKSHHIFTHYTSSSMGNAVHLKLYEWGALKFGFYNDDLNTDAWTMPFDTWTHVACTYDYSSDTSIIYFNGSLMETGNSGPYQGSIVDSWIGKSWTDEQDFDGIIDDVRIYNHPLTQEEIIAIVPEPFCLLLFSLGGVIVLKKRRYLRG